MAGAGGGARVVRLLFKCKNSDIPSSQTMVHMHILTTASARSSTWSKSKPSMTHWHGAALPCGPPTASASGSPPQRSSPTAGWAAPTQAPQAGSPLPAALLGSVAAWLAGFCYYQGLPGQLESPADCSLALRLVGCFLRAQLTQAVMNLLVQCLGALMVQCPAPVPACLGQTRPAPREGRLPPLRAPASGTPLPSGAPL